MNTPLIPPQHSDLSAEFSAATTTTCNLCKSTTARVERCVQRHPGATLMAVAGICIAAMLIVRALTPPPRHHAAQLLEDLQQRLYEIAEGGAQTVEQDVDRISDLHFETKLGKLSHGIKNLFHG